MSGKHYQKNRGKAGGKNLSGEPRFCCGRRDHGDKRHRRQCDCEGEGLPHRSQQRNGAENYDLSRM